MGAIKDDHTVGGATNSAAANRRAAGDGRTEFAAAEKGRYGNGNGIGAFLNEKAQFKSMPIWSTGIANKRGMETVEVKVGVMTPLDLPAGLVPPDVEVEGPFKYAPHAVKVSTGTTVKWVWTENPFTLVDPDNPWPHDVASVDMVNGDHLFHSPFMGTGSYEYTFDEPGTYLYYCHPHGNPFPDSPEEDNIFGMRGAVLVVDD
ncbi:hypothetical protein C5B90_08370 [Haloferax sp. Atlit-12N]|uniref:cupredoxin domain-containing protein n=1 Tax=Haloferax sp. Atlit-12N TaxID=2077203 RepID=UPI000E22BF97|nr:plastocyanin/azurin family copper-binding protein [Haloferax sp. Atlit-12N]RDZ63169.1 hypothetical protein C5B90_08370 [Haloferax sp. Atlit-12N]